MPIPFSQMKEFEDKRVLMRFDDDHEVIAHLLSAIEDMDGSHHLVYERVEWANDPGEIARAEGATVYAEGESLMSIEDAPDTLPAR
jgi:hypothetical protein